MRIVYYDLELDGLHLEAQVTQLGAVAMDGDKELGHFERKLKFDLSKSDPQALSLNGYDPEAWIFAVEPSQAIKSFAAWLGFYSDVEFVSKRTGRPYKVAKLGGFNCIAFDNHRLNRLFGESFKPWDQRTLDVMQLANWAVEFGVMDKPRFGLTLVDIANALGIHLHNAHDALADARATAQVASELRNRMTFTFPLSIAKPGGHLKLV